MYESDFNPAGRTVRFTPDGAGHRVVTGALEWDAELGAPASAKE